MSYNPYVFQFGFTYTIDRERSHLPILTVDCVGEDENNYVLQIQIDLFPISWKEKSQYEIIENKIRYKMSKMHNWSDRQIKHIGFWNETCKILYGKVTNERPHSQLRR